MLPTGFEPVSLAREAKMIGRATLREHFIAIDAGHTIILASLHQQKERLYTFKLESFKVRNH